MALSTQDHFGCNDTLPTVHEGTMDSVLADATFMLGSVQI